LPSNIEIDRKEKATSLEIAFHPLARRFKLLDEIRFYLSFFRIEKHSKHHSTLQQAVLMAYPPG
jgi:hypothetical protein